MNTIIYWNYRDNDSRNIYKFLGSPDFEAFCKKENISLFKKRDKFDKRDFWNEAQSHDTIFFFSHGVEDAVLKFRYKNEEKKEDYALATVSEIPEMAGKRIIAICCRSAETLGRKSMESEDPPVFYIGFTGDITYNEGFSEKVRAKIYGIYSDAFKETIYITAEKRLTGTDFSRELKHRIERDFTEAIINDNSKETEKTTLAEATFFHETVKTLTVYGDGSAKVFPVDK